jgi:hypothetical protein
VCTAQLQPAWQVTSAVTARALLCSCNTAVVVHQCSEAHLLPTVASPQLLTANLLAASVVQGCAVWPVLLLLCWLQQQVQAGDPGRV